MPRNRRKRTHSQTKFHASGWGWRNAPRVLNHRHWAGSGLRSLAEYCITQAEGFNARSLPDIVSRLSGHAQSGLYLRYIVALCNAQVEVIAPRRAYIALSGYLEFGGRRVDVDGFEGGSLWHTDDLYSPHAVALFGRGENGQKSRLAFASPHDETFWRPARDNTRRLYLAAG